MAPSTLLHGHPPAFPCAAGDLFLLDRSHIDLFRRNEPGDGYTWVDRCGMSLKGTLLGSRAAAERSWELQLRQTAAVVSCLLGLSASRCAAQLPTAKTACPLSTHVLTMHGLGPAWSHPLPLPLQWVA